MARRWRRRAVIAVVGLLAALIAAAAASVAYLTLADLGRHRELIAAQLSRRFGYEVRVGELHVDLNLRGASSLEARNLTLANPDWTAEPRLLQIDRVAVRVDLWPLLRRTVHVRDLEVEGARIAYTAGEDGTSNWSRPQPSSATGASKRSHRPRRVVIDRAEVLSLETTVRTPSLPQPLELGVARLELATDPADAVQVRLAGDLDARPFELHGSVAPVTQLLVVGSVRIDLALALAEARTTLKGEIADLARLGGMNLQLSADGPSIDAVTELFGLPSLGGGSFRLSAHARPDSGEDRISLQAALGELEARVEGELDSLIHPERLDATLRASGPSLAAAGALGGLRHLPDEPFEVSGHVVWAGFPISLEGMALRVGENRIGLDGVIGAPPSLRDSDLRFEGEGPNAATIASLFEVHLPDSPYRFSGHVDRTEHGLSIENLQVELGSNRLDAHGTVGEPPGFEDTALTFHVSGPSLSPFRKLAALELPDEPFEIGAEVRTESGALRIEQAKVRLGSESGAVAGRLVTGSGLAGSTLRVEAQGADLSHLAWAAPGIELPKSAFSVAGDLTIESGAVVVKGLAASAVGVEATLEGRVGTGPKGEGTDVTVHLAGTDVSVPLTLAHVDRAPHSPFELGGDVRITSGRVELGAVSAQLGEIRLDVSGSVPTAGGLDGASFTVSGEGARVSELTDFGAPSGLPDAPFTLEGQFRFEGENVRLGRTRVTLGDGNHIEVEGLVDPHPGLSGSELSVALQGPDLREAGRLAAELVEVPELPAAPFTLAFEVGVEGTGYDIHRLRATLGPAEASLSGRLGVWPDLEGTDLTFDVKGPNAALITAIAGLTVPVAPVDLAGRFIRDSEGFTFQDCHARLADYHASIEGRLGELPRLEGSDLVVRAEGPDLELFRQLLDTGPLPVQPFSVSVHATGSPLQFQVDDLDLRLGDSDLRGFARLGLEDRPRLKVRLESSRIDFRQLLEGRERPEDDGAASETAGEAAPRGEKVFSDEPFDLSVLHRFDADAEWGVHSLRLGELEFDEVSIDAALDQGHLDVGPIDVIGAKGGRLQGNLELEPSPAGYALNAHLELTDARVSLVRATTSPARPPSQLDVLMDVTAAGRSPHELAAGSNGRLIVSLDGGEVDSSIADVLGADLLLTIAKTLNPFHGEGSRTVALECAVVLGELEDGMFIIEPMAIKSENLTILGDGTVNFDTEKLEFEWVTKPRKGFGISASTITNRSVKLGGTLAHPAIGVKGIEAVTATGVAVATGGLSLLGRGLLDRITSSKKVCQKALKEAERRLAGEKPRHRSLLFQ